MDLIDRSKLHPVDVVEGIDGKIVFTTRSYWASDVANAPTVDAIPVEWIKKFNSIKCSETVEEMLRKWRKENGTN